MHSATCTTFSTHAIAAAFVAAAGSVAGGSGGWMAPAIELGSQLVVAGIGAHAVSRIVPNGNEATTANVLRRSLFALVTMSPLGAATASTATTILRIGCGLQTPRVALGEAFQRGVRGLTRAIAHGALGQVARRLIPGAGAVLRLHAAADAALRAFELVHALEDGARRACEPVPCRTFDAKPANGNASDTPRAKRAREAVYLQPRRVLTQRAG